MSIFAYISGIITLLGFLLQLKDIFPAHRESRKTLLLLVAGIFLGSVITSLQAVQLTVQIPDHPLVVFGYIVLVTLALFLFVVALVAITTTDNERKKHFLSFFGGGLPLFFIIGFVMILASATPTSTNNQLSVDEILMASKQRLEQKNYDRAIALLEIALSKVDVKDSRHASLLQQIEMIKKLQVAQIQH